MSIDYGQIRRVLALARPGEIGAQCGGDEFVALRRIRGAAIQDGLDVVGQGDNGFILMPGYYGDGIGQSKRTFKSRKRVRSSSE